MTGEADTLMGGGGAPLPLGARALQAAAAARATRAAGAASGGVTPGVAPATPAGPPDPLARPYQLPSRGIALFYPEAPGWDGTVLIAPTRGEEEELLGGASADKGAKLAVIRQLTQQLVRPTHPAVPLSRLTLQDWMAASIHFLAISRGTDQVGLRPTHERPLGCGQASDQTRALAALSCTVLRVAEGAETPNWPDVLVDGEEAVLREMAEEETEAQGDGKTTERLVPATVTEPFHATVADTLIAWRMLRVDDMRQGEEFIARTGDAQTKPGSPFYNFMLSRQIVGIGNRPVSTIEALQWVRRTPSYELDELREAIDLHRLGYNMQPRFRCPHCGGSWRVKLPLDASLFRRGRARARGRPGVPGSPP